jgi:hypothetical protein
VSKTSRSTPRSPQRLENSRPAAGDPADTPGIFRQAVTSPDQEAGRGGDLWLVTSAWVTPGRIGIPAGCFVRIVLGAGSGQAIVGPPGEPPTGGDKQNDDNY